MPPGADRLTPCADYAQLFKTLFLDHIDHIKTYLKEEFEFDGGYLELSRETNRLREPVCKRLVEELTENPDMRPVEIREYIEGLMEEFL